FAGLRDIGGGNLISRQNMNIFIEILRLKAILARCTGSATRNTFIVPLSFHLEGPAQGHRLQVLSFEFDRFRNRHLTSSGKRMVLPATKWITRIRRESNSAGECDDPMNSSHHAQRRRRASYRSTWTNTGDAYGSSTHQAINNA